MMIFLKVQDPKKDKNITSSGGDRSDDLRDVVFKEKKNAEQQMNLLPYSIKCDFSGSLEFVV